MNKVQQAFAIEIEKILQGFVGYINNPRTIDAMKAALQPVVQQFLDRLPPCRVCDGKRILEVVAHEDQVTVIPCRTCTGAPVPPWPGEERPIEEDVEKVKVLLMQAMSLLVRGETVEVSAPNFEVAEMIKGNIVQLAKDNGLGDVEDRIVVAVDLTKPTG